MSMCVSSSIGKVKMLNNISWMVGDYFEVFSFTLKIKSLFFLGLCAFGGIQLERVYPQQVWVVCFYQSPFFVHGRMSLRRCDKPEALRQGQGFVVST